MLCLNVGDQQDGDAAASNQDIINANKDDSKDKEKDYQAENDIHAAYKGAGKGKKGSKGYGECWHCGEWGHPRRECPHFNEPTEVKGAIAALKGGKSNGGKGEGKYGKYGKGKSNGKGKWNK